MLLIKVATYNVHQWIGRDGRRDVPRVIDVICDLQAHVVGLQEATYPQEQRGEHGLDYISRRTGMTAVLGPTLLREDGHFGNILLSSYPVQAVRRIDLAVSGREPRGALDVDISVEKQHIRVVVVHLGLSNAERHNQIERLLKVLGRLDHRPVVLMGDFNVWVPKSRLLARLKKDFGNPPSLRTFPSFFPVLSLDRIWVSPSGLLKNMKIHSTRAARKASDHLPVKAEIHLS